MYESPFAEETVFDHSVIADETTPQTGEVPIEELILGGHDDRSLFTKTSMVPYRWICSMQCMVKNAQYGPGRPRWKLARKATGFLIGPSSVLTAAHNLWFSSGSRWRSFDRIIVTPGLNERDEPFGSVVARRWLTASQWRPPQNPRQVDIPPSPWDFAVIRLNTAIGEKRFPALGNKALGSWGSSDTFVKALRLDWLRKKKWKLFTAGYPLDKCGRMHLANKKAIDACAQNTPGDWASTMWRSIGALERPNYPPGFILHSCDAKGGQSGSPVWYYWYDSKNKCPKRWVVGIHAGGDRQFTFPGGSRGETNYAVWIRPAVISEVTALEARLP